MVGAVEAGFGQALRDGRLSESLDAPAMQLARSLAVSIDARAGDPEANAVGVAKLASELRQVLQQLRMTPATRGDDATDEFAQFLRAVTGSAEVGDGPNPWA